MKKGKEVAHQKYAPGWLDRQFRLAREDIATWPQWLRDEIERAVDRYYPRSNMDDSVKVTDDYKKGGV